MSSAHSPNREIRLIPVADVDVLNPRDRNTRVFEDVVANIKRIGLKKPITVTPRSQSDGRTRYLLICGEGRLKAYKGLGQAQIPAIVLNVDEKEALIMSLAENIARRHGRPLELLSGIQQLQSKGYPPKTIAAKTGLTVSYVQGILSLLNHGEERLVVAVEQGKIPLNAALNIVGAGDSDRAVQLALQEAYEAGTLRGKSLLDARRVVERRQTLGRSNGRGTPRKPAEVTSSSLVRTYQREVARQRLTVKKAELAQQRLLLLVGAMRTLLADENFVTLLRAEGLSTMPQYLADRVWPSGVRA